MVRIDRNTPEHVQLLDWYFKKIKDFYKVGIAGRRSKLQKLIGRLGGTMQGLMFEFLLNNLEQIIKSEPKDLKQWQLDIEAVVGYDPGEPAHRTQFSEFKKRMAGHYTLFFQKMLNENGKNDSTGRWMTQKLGLNICSYCNHNYTLTLSRKKSSIRPDFDHFFSKSEHPLLALSFYNLIPICSTCNSLKSDAQLVHSPYDERLSFPRFQVHGINAGGHRVLFGLGMGLSNIEITTDANYHLLPPQLCNMEKLMINDVYKHQVDYVQEILDAAQQYNAGSYDALLADFQAIGKQPAEIDRIIWGYYRDEHHKRPLSKLTQDVLEQIGRKEI